MINQIELIYIYIHSEQSSEHTHIHTKRKTYDVGNPGPGYGQAQKCSGVKPANGIPTLPSWQLDPQWQYLYKQTIKNLHRFASTYYHKNEWQHKHGQ